MNDKLVVITVEMGVGSFIVYLCVAFILGGVCMRLLSLI
jgi:hypothetical protein